MAFFNRKTLTEKGLTEEQITYIMAESGRKLAADYEAKSDFADRLAAELEKAKTAPVNVEESEAYKALAAERDMLRALGGEDFAAVKPKFREAAYKMIDRADGAASLEDQLKGIREKYEEYFIQDPTTTAPALQFGAGVKGAMPTGNQKPDISELWFGKRKER